MGTYLIVTFALQMAGLLVSRLVDLVDPTLSLMTFLVLFMGMFWLGWPIAVRIVAYLIPENERERAARLAQAARA
jgi:hypothetical protein